MADWYCKYCSKRINLESDVWEFHGDFYCHGYECVFKTCRFCGLIVTVSQESLVVVSGASGDQQVSLSRQANQSKNYTTNSLGRYRRGCDQLVEFGCSRQRNTSRGMESLRSPTKTATGFQWISGDELCHRKCVASMTHPVWQFQYSPPAHLSSTFRKKRQIDQKRSNSLENGITRSSESRPKLLFKGRSSLRVDQEFRVVDVYSDGATTDESIVEDENEFILNGDLETRTSCDKELHTTNVFSTSRPRFLFSKPHRGARTDVTHTPVYRSVSKPERVHQVCKKPVDEKPACCHPPQITAVTKDERMSSLTCFICAKLVQNHCQLFERIIQLPADESSANFMRCQSTQNVSILEFQSGEGEAGLVSRTRIGVTITHPGHCPSQLCRGCHQRILPSEQKVTLKFRRSYHAQCLQCFGCGDLLANRLLSAGVDWRPIAINGIRAMQPLCSVCLAKSDSKLAKVFPVGPKIFDSLALSPKHTPVKQLLKTKMRESQYLQSPFDVTRFLSPESRRRLYLRRDNDTRHTQQTQSSIFSAQFFRAANTRFECCRCGAYISPAEGDIQLSHLVCIHCVERVCPSCDRPVFSGLSTDTGYQVRTLNGRKYHGSCFKCTHCGKHVAQGQEASIRRLQGKNLFDLFHNICLKKVLLKQLQDGIPIYDY